MFQSHVLSFFLLIFANTGCNESAATELMYTPAACKESVSFLPTREKTNPAGQRTPLLRLGGDFAEKTSDQPKLSLNDSPKADKKRSRQKEGVEKDSRININEATSTELEALPGIGPALAKRILDYRKKRKFKRLKDIRRVKGIGFAKYKKLKEKIRLK